MNKLFSSIFTKNLDFINNILFLLDKSFTTIFDQYNLLINSFWKYEGSMSNFTDKQTDAET